MRNMSFSLTTEQYRNRTKTVTRRLGWSALKPGDVFMGVVKTMGLKRGEKVERMHASRCVSNRTERLDEITREDCIKEGFPTVEPPEFIGMFAKHNGCTESTLVQRIEFEHLMGQEEGGQVNDLKARIAAIIATPLVIPDYNGMVAMRVLLRDCLSQIEEWERHGYKA